MSKIEKRADLQGIRGIAIISVVGFHFFPDYVPNGYLGVDQFFVLSGFLMSMLLQNSSDQPVLSQVIQFYSKRFKRIVPLYFLLIGGSMISLYCKFPEVSWKTNKEAGKRAMIFMSNRRRTAEEDYFQMLSLAIDIFTHTWSLSVEVQFYLILPLIYLLGRLFSKNLQYGYYFLIALVTCLAASILVSIAIHETFEKWYSKQGLGTVTLVTLALVMVNLVLLNKDEIMDKLKGAKDYGSPDKMTLEKAARLNHLWNLNDYGSLFVPACDYESRNSPFGWCRHKNLSGSLRIMIIGNSWAANHGTMFHQECGRFVTIGDDSGPTGDLIYEIMRRQMKKLIKNVGRKMYILDAMPRPNIEVIERIVPMIGRGIGRGDIDNLLVNHTLYRTARRRYAQLVNDCGKKCVLVDYNPVFWNSTTRNFRFYDEQGLSYFTTTTHLTPRGIEHVRHVWRDICDSLEK
uniref:Acyl_transf_3 domain-containing protein n=1 Tax=Caenorhabditis tropicalis TaxID=1561998 RepID=A0A1I7UZA3_9PELO